MTTMRTTILLMTTILFAACALGPQVSQATLDAITLTAEPLDDDTVRLTLRNDSAESVGYNLCASRLQRRDASLWMPVETGEVCTMEIRTAAAGTSATFEKTLPADVGAGEYRYTTSIEVPLGTPQRPLVSQTFRID